MLQSGKDPLSLFFQGIAEQGHYAGRVKPTRTRQGIYAFAANGTFLASVNTRDPKRMARMLREAWAKWEALDAESRVVEGLPERRGRPEDRFPDGGVIIEAHSRDLPRDELGGMPLGPRTPGWHQRASNRDQAWFRATELRRLLPEKLEIGAEVAADRAIIDRLARFHLVDNVRGQIGPYSKESVAETTLSARVVAASEETVTLALEGVVAIEMVGRWFVPDERRDEDVERRRGIKGRWDGTMVWNLKTDRPERFELLAIGARFGATRYNARARDQGPAPMGVAFRLAPQGTDPVRPAFIWSYPREALAR